MNQLHWYARRIIDPVGKLMDDLSYLKFRRHLLLSIAKIDGKEQLGVHEDCLEKFQNMEFFSKLGSEQPLYPVKIGEQTKFGALEYACACQREDSPSCKKTFEGF